MATATFKHTTEEFRVCPVTSFRVDRKAELLMVFNAVVSILCLSMTQQHKECW